jgi:signal transduction histidine kinase
VKFFKLKIKEKEQLTLIDIVLRNAKRLQRLTEDILDVARIEGKSLNLRRERINLNEIILNMLAEYGSQVKNVNKLKIEFTPKDDNLIVVEGNEARIKVLSNILSNTIRFTEEGSIIISTERVDNNIIVSVKDTGIGIHPEIVPRLFEKFASKSSEGTGLGLYISKSIVEAHDGRIRVENNNPDEKGATFSFSLPLSEN